MEARILRIDLTTRSHEIEAIPDVVLRRYLGGRGLGSYLLYQSVAAGTDPLSEDNHVIFTAGPASGTNFYFSSKTNVNTKSPLTGIYMHSISSGILGHQMRKAGLWAIDIGGIANGPTYLAIQNDRVEFRDATSLWGMETARAQQAMLEGLSSKEAATTGIGPAGEQLVPYAALFCQGPLYRTFGRGGGQAALWARRSLRG